MSLLLPELERQLRAAARARGRAAQDQPSHPARRHRVALALGGALTVAAVVVVVVSGLGGGRTSAVAAAVERAALAAQRGLAAPSLAPGQYWYTRTIRASMTGVSSYPAPAHRGKRGLRRLAAPGLIQSRQVQERWVGTDGSARVRSANDGPVQFFWRTTGTQPPGPVPFEQRLPAGTGYRSPLGAFSYPEVLALPTDPARMLARIRASALSFQQHVRRFAPGSTLAERSLAQSELEVISGALVDLPLTPGSRAAVYRAMKDIPGVSYLPSVRDPLGRRGVALSSNESVTFIDGTGPLRGPQRVTNELVFDPSTGALLAQQSVLDEPIPSIGLPAGYPVEYSAYVVSGNVASTHERFVPHAGGERIAPVPSTPSCETAGPAPAQLVSGPMPSAFLHDFSVLNRPATGQDHLPKSTLPGPWSVELSSILESSIRLVRSTPNGARDYMIVGYRRSQRALPPRRCLPVIRRANPALHELEKVFSILAGENRVLSDLAAQRGAQRAKPQAVVCVFEVGGNHGFGCLSPSAVDSIAYEASDYGRPPATVTGIVPDGVAKIQASYADGRRIDAPVEHNLLIYQVGLAAPNAAPKQVVWLNAQGHAIRRLEQTHTR
jgi:hypothetical protein